MIWNRSWTGTETFPKSEPEPQYLITVPQHFFLINIFKNIKRQLLLIANETLSCSVVP